MGHRKSHEPTAFCLFHDRVSTTHVSLLTNCNKLMNERKIWTAVGQRVLAALHFEETGFKQLVSFNVKLLLHETTASILDMKSYKMHTLGSKQLHFLVRHPVRAFCFFHIRNEISGFMQLQFHVAWNWMSQTSFTRCAHRPALPSTVRYSMQEFKFSWNIQSKNPNRSVPLMNNIIRSYGIDSRRDHLQDVSFIVSLNRAAGTGCLGWCKLSLR